MFCGLEASGENHFKFKKISHGNPFQNVELKKKQ
jgi:hypothetical protein